MWSESGPNILLTPSGKVLCSLGDITSINMIVVYFISFLLLHAIHSLPGEKVSIPGDLVNCRFLELRTTELSQRLQIFDTVV